MQTSIDIVAFGHQLGTLKSELTKEKVIGIRSWTSYAKDLYEIMELTMYITDDSDGRRDVYNVALSHEHLFRLFAYFA
jgi:hypothetical protein